MICINCKHFVGCENTTHYAITKEICKEYEEDTMTDRQIADNIIKQGETPAFINNQYIKLYRVKAFGHIYVITEVKGKVTITQEGVRCPRN